MTKSSGGAGRAGRTKAQSFEDFARERRVTSEPDHSFLRGRTNVSNRQVKNQDRRYRQEVDAKYQERANLRNDYNAAVASGTVRPLTRRESLLKAAQGHPDNPSTQAARRLLAKQGIKF